MVPKYFAFFTGSDGLLGGCIGSMTKVGVIFWMEHILIQLRKLWIYVPDFSSVNANPTF